MRAPRALLLLLLACLAGTPAARAASVEETLNARWRGGWVVVKLPIASNCDGFYNDNEVVGTRADSRARRRFAAGELAHVERIEVKRNRMDVFLNLAEQVLEPREDGPFTLYDARTCKVQLKIGLSGERNDAARSEARLSEILELHATAEKAEGSQAWSGRRREAYPEGYERTLAAYESWKAIQVNAAVQERMDEAIDEASRVKERIRSDPEYLEGFAAGIEKVRDTYFGDCASLTRQTFSPASPPGGHDSDWRRGYEDGQRLGYDLELLRRLRSCFVEVPAPEP